MHNTHAQGFSVLELITVLLIIAISVSTTLPSLTSINENALRRAHLGVLVRALHLTRTTAISSNKTATLCASIDRIHCTGQWHEGTILFRDDNNNLRRDSSEKLYDVGYALESGAKITWRASGGRNHAIRFSPNGAAKEFGTFTYCPRSKENKRAGLLIVNRQGRIHIGRDHNGDGIVEKPDGQRANC